MFPPFIGLTEKWKYWMNLLTSFYINSTKKVFFGRIFTKVKCKFDIMPYNQFYEKWVSAWERNIKLLLETVTCIATTETVTCITTIEIVMCIMHCRKYYLHDCNRGSHLHSFNKNCHPHICCRNFHLYNCSKKIHQHKCSRKYYQHNCNRTSKTA